MELFCIVGISPILNVKSAQPLPAAPFNDHMEECCKAFIVVVVARMHMKHAAKIPVAYFIILFPSNLVDFTFNMLVYDNIFFHLMY